jgi:hypothetical protein
MTTKIKKCYWTKTARIFLAVNIFYYYEAKVCPGESKRDMKSWMAASQ